MPTPDQQELLPPPGTIVETLYGHMSIENIIHRTVEASRKEQEQAHREKVKPTPLTTSSNATL